MAQVRPCPPPTFSVAGGTSTTSNCQSSTGTLVQQYPGDLGIAADADVVWHENFELTSVSAIAARYSDSANIQGMALNTSVPARSRGNSSLRMTSNGSGTTTTNLFKNFGAGHDELYIRYYVKYQGGAPWHHTGVWFGGYNPASNWPNPQAGLRPTGSDRFSIGFEPAATGNDVRLDFYNYWRGMHSWMASPSGSTAYYGNSILQDTNVKAINDAWTCIEIHSRLNQDMNSGAGAELELWVNDTLIRKFTSTTPDGYWVADKFCPADSTYAGCTNYRNSGTTLAPLDMQWRTTTALKHTYLWLQNYISSGGEGSVVFDDVVVAKRRVGCLQ